MSLPYPRRRSFSPGFTLVEILIVVMILGILAAIVVPRFADASGEARQVALKDQLRVLREQITIFRSQHNDVAPGLTSSGLPGTAALFIAQLTGYSDVAGSTSATKTATFHFGPYLQMSPGNPINGLSTVKIDSTLAAPAADDTTGWIYQPLTGKVFANTSATDANGKAYVSY